MKRIFTSFVLFLAIFCSQNAFAAIVTPMAEGEFQEYINKIGFTILNRNEIENRIVFKYSDSKDTRGKYTENMVVYVPKGIIMNVETEDELAAAIAFQTANCLKYAESKNTKISTNLSPIKYEQFADKRTVDMLVKAGYSPLAHIILINKSFGENKKDRFHQKTSIRLANIYEYIVKKYPEQLKNQKFAMNIYFQNFLLTSRKNRELLQERMLNDANSADTAEYR